MLTHATTSSTSIATGSAPLGHDPAAHGSAQKVVIVNGSAEVMELLEAVLDAGHYDIVFVESNEHAYSQIKRVQPNLVILCVQISDMDSFHVLSMLKIDSETRQIPVLTYTTGCDGDEADEEEAESAEPELFPAKPAPLQMN
jgi:PleD family two-component response regulator